jgi:hypothetical protein
LTFVSCKGYIKILKDLIKTLQKEKTELTEKFDFAKQQLNDYKLDLKLLREQLTRQRVGNVNEGLTTRIKSTTMSTERELKSIKELELLRERNSQLENDVKLILCEKEELEIERDSLRLKIKALSEISRSSSEIDKILGENKRLKEQVDDMRTTESFAQTSKLNSIKNESLKKSYSKTQIKFILNKTECYLVKCKQQNKTQSPNFAYVSELHELCATLFDNLLDKNLALEHQRKCNRMLAERIKDLESELSVNRKDLSSSLIRFDDLDEGEYLVQPVNQSNTSDLLSTSNDRLLNDVSGREPSFGENFKDIDLNGDDKVINA